MPLSSMRGQGARLKSTARSAQRSSGACCRGQDKLIQDIEARIARWTLLPVGNGEGLQVQVALLGPMYDVHAALCSGQLGGLVAQWLAA